MMESEEQKHKDERKRFSRSFRFRGYGRPTADNFWIFRGGSRIFVLVLYLQDRPRPTNNERTEEGMNELNRKKNDMASGSGAEKPSL